MHIVQCEKTLILLRKSEETKLGLIDVGYIIHVDISKSGKVNLLSTLRFIYSH